MGEVTRLLGRWNGGDGAALKELIGAVHGELRVLARSVMRHERDGHTLQPTDLVHEAYLRLEGLREMTFANRAHFYGAAAEAMRRVLVDHARRRQAEKRGGHDLHVVPLDQVLNLPIDLRVDFVRLSDVLEDLRQLSPEKAKVVDLRYFAGLSIEETAAVLQVAPATVKRHWSFARAWLFTALDG